MTTPVESWMQVLKAEAKFGKNMSMGLKATDPLPLIDMPHGGWEMLDMARWSLEFNYPKEEAEAARLIANG